MAEIYSDINQGVLKNIPSNSTVLDVGCGTGILGEALKTKKNCRVYGIEFSKESARISAKRLDGVHVLDIENQEFRSSIKFDVIIFADVLEHLRNPEKVLPKYTKLLKPGGRFVISLPNVANWTMRLKLLFGNFTYARTGILDETHLRFFTLNTIKQFMTRCNLKIDKMDLNPNFIRFLLPLIRKLFGSDDESIHEQILNSRSYKVYTSFILPVETFIAKLWKRMFAYQFVIVASPKQ